MNLRIIGGKFKGRFIKTPRGDTTRPTASVLREAFFNICQNTITGARFLDLFAGSGAMGFEALSRGAAHACFVENNKAAIACIRETIEQLQLGAEAILYPLDYRVALKTLHKKNELFDFIYIDPPYHRPLEPILDELGEFDIIRPGGTIFVEQRSLHTKPYSPPLLTLLTTRRFGDSLLQEYKVREESGDTEI